jgi:toxin ParE1/3/4
LSKNSVDCTTVHFTERALRDLNEIEAYSIAQFGKRTATEYIDAIQAAVVLIQENPGLLRQEPAVSVSSLVYRVRKHLLICESVQGAIFILTILHGAMDVPNRLLELQPSLAQESHILSRRLRERMEG